MVRDVFLVKEPQPGKLSVYQFVRWETMPMQDYLNGD